jgi:NAD(P)-dependent dehydrogenase (short-subunit alcohol dehydrogenase family)
VIYRRQRRPEFYLITRCVATAMVKVAGCEAQGIDNRYNRAEPQLKRTNEFHSHSPSSLSGSPLKRMTTNEKTVEFIKLLASNSTAFITGQTIMFDGGRYMR